MQMMLAQEVVVLEVVEDLEAKAQVEVALEAVGVVVVLEVAAVVVVEALAPKEDLEEGAHQVGLDAENVEKMVTLQEIAPVVVEVEGDQGAESVVKMATLRGIAPTRVLIHAESVEQKGITRGTAPAVEVVVEVVLVGVLVVVGVVVHQEVDLVVVLVVAVVAVTPQEVEVMLTKLTINNNDNIRLD